MRFAVFLFSVFPLFSLSAFCGTPADDALATQTLLLGNGAEPQDLDPQVISAYTDQNIAIGLFEGLVAIDEATSKSVPGVAESWSVSDDGLVWTFHLRANARWSNGDPVTASDFVASFQRMLSPVLGADYAYMLFPIKNAEAFNSGKLADFSKVGVAAPDARTLVVTLESPVPHLLSIAAQPAWFPVHIAAILRFGKLDQRGTAWTRPGNLVGNGAFMLKSWTPNKEVTIVKNPNYWDAANTRLNTVVFFPNDDIATDERNFRAGQVHITYDILPEKIPVYRKNNPAALRIDPLLETYFLRFNVTRPPLDNPKVRAALARAMNRPLISKLLNGSRTPAYCLTPPDTGGYTCVAAARVTDDFAAARRLLAEAGFPGGKNFPVLDIQMNTDAVNKIVLEAIQEMWRRELGVNVTLSNKDFRVYLDAQREVAYDISRSRWVGDFNDPVTFLDMFVTGGGNNQTNWSNAEYDRLIAEAGRTLDQTKRFELYQRAEKILLDEAPIAPVFFGTRSYLISSHVKNWVPALLGFHRYQKVWLE